MIPVACCTPSCMPDDVAAGDVAELVRDHALHLVGIVGRGDQAGMDVDDLAAGDEGVDLAVVDQDDLDVLGLKPGRLDQRPRDVAQQRLGLGVAQDRLGRGRLRARRRSSSATSISSRTSKVAGRRVLG